MITQENLASPFYLKRKHIGKTNENLNFDARVYKVNQLSSPSDLMPKLTKIPNLILLNAQKHILTNKSTPETFHLNGHTTVRNLFHCT